MTRQTLLLTSMFAMATVLAFARQNTETTIESMPPSVVKTVPQSGETNVDPDLNEIRVTFSKDMMTDRMWAFCQISDDTFPERPEGQEIRYLADKRTCVMPVKLESEKTYVIWINRGKFNSFRDVTNNPAVPYLLVFRTRNLSGTEQDFRAPPAGAESTD